MDDLASLSMIGLRVEIEAEQILLQMLGRRSDYCTPDMVAAHRRIELLEAERLHRTGSGFGKKSS